MRQQPTHWKRPYCWKRPRQKEKMRWLDSITDSMHMHSGKLWDMVRERKDWCAAVNGVARRWTQLKRLNNNKTTVHLQKHPTTLHTHTYSYMSSISWLSLNKWCDIYEERSETILGKKNKLKHSKQIFLVRNQTSCSTEVYENKMPSQNKNLQPFYKNVTQYKSRSFNARSIQFYLE